MDAPMRILVPPISNKRYILYYAWVKRQKSKGIFFDR
jgi:hypothetical protein